MSINFDELVQKYVQLRDRLAAEKAAADVKLNKIKAVMEKLENVIQMGLIETGQNSANTAHGTAYLSTETSVSIADWEAYLAFVRETERWELLKRAASKEAVTLYREENVDEDGTPQLPPGINFTQIKKVNIQVSAKQRSAA